MIIAYLAIAVVSAVAFAADMILRYMEKIKGFGLEKELFAFRGKTIPIENFFPHSLTMIFAFCFALGLCGLVMELMSFGWYISLPCGVICAMLVSFLSTAVKARVRRAKKEALPKKFDFSGKEAVVTDFIAGDGWGKVKLVYNDADYIFNAVSANETDIDEGEKVTVVLENDGMLFVERDDEVFDPLNEKEETKNADT